MSIRSFALLLLVAVAVLALAVPAHGEVTGGCDGRAVLDGVTYTPANDTPDNPIVIPAGDGVVATVEGSAPFDNNGHSGTARVHIGPAPIEVAAWQDDNGPAPNASSVENETYAIDELRSKLPFDIVGIYKLSGDHSSPDGACSGHVYLEFEGSAASSPVALAAAATGGVSLLLLAIAALALTSLAPGLVRGRRWLGAVAGLLLGFSVAVLLQQLSLWPLDNLTVIALPLLLAVAGFALAMWAPLGRGRLLSPRGEVE